MSRGDTTTFTWSPTSPTRQLSCRVITDADSIGENEFAVALTARDAEGGEILPSTTRWRHSEAIGAHFAYTAPSQSPVSPVAPWTSETFPDRFEIDVVTWNQPDDSTTTVVGLALATGDPEPGDAQGWIVLAPVSKEDAR